MLAALGFRWGYALARKGCPIRALRSGAARYVAVRQRLGAPPLPTPARQRIGKEWNRRSVRALLFQFFAHLYDVYGPSSSDPFRDGCAKGKTVCQLACCSLPSQDAAIRSDATRVPIAVQSRRISRVAIDAGDARRKKQRSATLPPALQPPCCCACARGGDSSYDRSPAHSRSAARSRKGRPSPTFCEGHQYHRRSRRCRGTRTPCRATS